MDVAYERVKEIAMKHYPGCKSEEAWKEPCSYQFQQCTKEISGSNEKIHVPLYTIENLAANTWNATMAIDIQISQLMEGVNPFDKKGHMPLIKYLQDLSGSFEKKSSCAEKSKYSEIISNQCRKTISFCKNCNFQMSLLGFQLEHFL